MPSSSDERRCEILSSQGGLRRHSRAMRHVLCDSWERIFDMKQSKIKITIDECNAKRWDYFQRELGHCFAEQRVACGEAPDAHIALADHRLARTLVASLAESGEVAGVAVVWRPMSSYNNNEHALLTDMCVAPASRKNGVGEALVGAAAAVACEAFGAAVMCAEVWAVKRGAHDPDALLRWYERIGMRRGEPYENDGMLKIPMSLPLTNHRREAQPHAVHGPCARSGLRGL